MNGAGREPRWNQDVVLDYQQEEEIEFIVFDEESMGSDKFIGSAKLSITAVIENGGSWAGDLQLFRHKKPAGLLNLHIYMLSPEAAETGSSVSGHVAMHTLPKTPDVVRNRSGSVSGGSPFTLTPSQQQQAQPVGAPQPQQPMMMQQQPMMMQQPMMQQPMMQQPMMMQQPVMGQPLVGQVAYAQPMYAQPVAYAQPVVMHQQPQVVYAQPQQPTRIIYTHPQPRYY